MNAEMAEQENKEASEVKNEAKPEDSQVEDNNNTADEVKTEKKVEANSAAVSNLRLLENIEVRLTVEVGNTEIKIKDLLRLNEGSWIDWLVML